ncbi:MAG: ChaN family lipoprotein [Hyphomicrobiaceae bacterium]
MQRQIGRRTCLVAAAMLWLAATAEAAQVAWPKTWVSTELADHPLVGKIYVPKTKKYVTPKQYLRTLTWPRFVLLGEIHDNADHHILQGLAIRSMGEGRPPVVFEQFQTNQQPLIDAFQTGLAKVDKAASEDPATRLFLATNWSKSGWPDQDIFRPLIESVLARRGRIIAGNPPRARVRKTARAGLDALSSDAQRRLRLDRPLADDLKDGLLTELEASHCGLMPKSAFGNMAMAQRFRDGHMARAMVDAAALGEGPVALVAGNGHVRLDRGVPWYIERMMPEAQERPLLSVGHVEVIKGKTRPEDYADAVAQHSLIVFTPRATRKDPCVEMRKRFGAHKKK